MAAGRQYECGAGVRGDSGRGHEGEECGRPGRVAHVAYFAIFPGPATVGVCLAPLIHLAGGMRLIGPILVLLLVAATGWTDDSSGGRLYAERCSGCHGDRGGGDGPAAAALIPKPKNFRDPGYWKERTLEQLHTIVKKGKPGTMMPAFDGTLSDAEIDAVLQTVKGFAAEPPK